MNTDASLPALEDRRLFLLRYSVSLGREVQVAELAHGTMRFGEWLLAFHGRPLRPPPSPRYLPEEQFIDWHQRDVFRGPAREASAT